MAEDFHTMNPDTTATESVDDFPFPRSGGLGVEKLDVESLHARDNVEIRTTEDVIYAVCIGKHLHAILTSSNKQARALQIIICGGTNADSSEYTPNRVFVGGRLAYTFEKDSATMLTTPVIAAMSYLPGPK